MQNTTNLNLKKPDQTDYVNISDINDNMDVIDAALVEKYEKPSTGVPKTDLAQNVQTSLEKADTALQTVDKNSVGLGNVDNTSDANKPISTATQNALNLKAPLASPAFTGAPTAPTAASSTNNTQIATTEFVKTAISTKAETTTVTSLSESVTAHQVDDTKHLTNGYLKVNNGSTNFLLKMDADGLYLEEV